VTNYLPTDPLKPYRIDSQVEDAEIVPWLRINAEHASRASHPSWLMFCVAADAIERLTTERDEARALSGQAIWDRTKSDEANQAWIIDLQKRCDQAVRERDEARREVCLWQGLDTGNTPRDTAMVRGWDCYKEETK
jgi:hypothetical protein